MKLFLAGSALVMVSGSAASLRTEDDGCPVWEPSPIPGFCNNCPVAQFGSCNNCPNWVSSGGAGCNSCAVAKHGGCNA
jgi:hypothetical protein